VAELLVFNRTNTNADPVKDERGCYKRGDIVNVSSDDFYSTYGGGYSLPDFVIFKVPGLSLSAAEAHKESWNFDIDYAIVQTNPAQDGARIRVFAVAPGSARGLTRPQVEGFINSWGGSVVSVATNEVRFDITIQSIYKSEGFWEVNPAALGIVITETNYVQATGIHTATIDLTASNVKPAAAQARVESKGGTVLSYAAGIATVTFERVAVRQAFQNAVRAAIKKVWRRRRYGMPIADVDAAVAAGGVLTITQAELASKLLDRAV
jgi:hypothetical protein